MEENKFSLKSCLANLDLMIAGTVLENRLWKKTSSA